jgi:hypothetical protein
MRENPSMSLLRETTIAFVATRNGMRKLVKAMSLLKVAAAIAIVTAVPGNASAGLVAHGNPIPPRLQWEANGGYCGEVSLISAGLYYGQYVSQYEARICAIGKTPQDKGELLLGVNDLRAAAKMHLRAVEWNGSRQKNSAQFLRWVRNHVLRGHPVAIGVFNNENWLYGKTNPDAGDPTYDHIVPVISVAAHRQGGAFAAERLTFSDNGLWGRRGNYPYFFTYRFGAFPKNRQQANAPRGPLYSLPAAQRNYGVAILGVNGDTLPVRVWTGVNYESPAMRHHSNQRPAAMPLTLTVVVSGLTPGVNYRLYRYDSLAAIPDSNFNAHAGQAAEARDIRIDSGDSYTFTRDILSDEVAAWRCVEAAAP